MSSLFDTIVNIINTAKEKGHVAVFKIDGKVKIIPISNTKRYNSMLIDYSRHFIGVFDQHCPPSVLKENLE